MGLKTLKGKKSPTISIGGQAVEVKPLTLENSLRLVLLLAPHIAKIERHWGKLKGNPRLLETILKELVGELVLAPGDIVTAYALLLDKPPEWIAQEATAKELLEALPTLDKVNDFLGLWAACKSLGITGSQ